jgi:nucleotide-binding universal stress UspA family protein
MKKILLPIDVPDTALSVVHQAAFLARHFRGEIILLHVLSPLRYPSGLLERGHMVTARDLESDIVARTQRDLEEALRSELEGIAVRRLLLRGDPAREILRTARDEQVNLIALSTHAREPVYRFLLGSVAAKVLHNSEYPVWTTVLSPGIGEDAFSIRRILCAVDLTEHSRHTVSRAANLAAEFGASLTLVHITTGIQSYGPGGSYIKPEWKATVIGYATEQMARLQKDVGTKAEVVIDSGDVHKLLKQAADHTKSDLLVIGHMPPGGHLGENASGYSIIRGSHIPVLSL